MRKRTHNIAETGRLRVGVLNSSEGYTWYYNICTRAYGSFYGHHNERRREVVKREYVSINF